jgi:negative regulator of flagellin synthesis FlgM
MRIDSFQPSNSIADTQSVTRPDNKKAQQAQVPAQDTANISERARLQQRAAQAPDVRQERVAAIKQQMQAGTYNVSDSQLADAMMKEFASKK